MATIAVIVLVCYFFYLIYLRSGALRIFLWFATNSILIPKLKYIFFVLIEEAEF